MSNYMPMGTLSILESMEDSNTDIRSTEILMQRALEDAYSDAVCKFYDVVNGSWSLAESFSRTWAKKYEEGDWEDADISNITEKLDLSWRDCYAILGNTKALMKEIERDNSFWYEKYQ